MAATTPGERGKWARRGLSFAGELNRTTQAMLLRQLYLWHYALRRFELAYQAAVQAAGLEILADVMHQDAARAMQALGDVDGAAGHLRIASRVAPASRRAFHWWTLGSVLYVAGRNEEAIGALERAARWATTEKPLYQGHLALAKCAAGMSVRGLDKVIARLAKCPAGQGYGRFVLGQLSFERERHGDARGYLEAFVQRTKRGRRTMRIALEPELALAQQTLEAMR